MELLRAIWNLITQPLMLVIIGLGVIGAIVGLIKNRD